jgi:hypothetical protein
MRLVMKKSLRQSDRNIRLHSEAAKLRDNEHTLSDVLGKAAKS